jgi:peptidoglycan biosynthesis protein MviN/MurJ (putative lipid II flippase)
VGDRPETGDSHSPGLPFSAALTTFSAAIGMGAGAIFAVLIASRYGSTARTDGFFVAYGLYSMFGVLGQGWRTSIVPRLVESPTTFGSFNRYCGAAFFIFVLAGVAMVVFRAPVTGLLTGSLPPEAQATAQTALVILWPAAGAQLFAGLAASMLGVLGEYAHPAASYALGSVIGIVSFVALEPTLGLDALATGVSIGAVTTMVMITFALVRAGWRPKLSILTRVSGNLRAGWLLIYTSLSLIGASVMSVIINAAAARLGPGSVTWFNYASAGQGIVKALVSLSLPVVLAAPLATTWDRRPSSLRRFSDDALRSGMVLLIPAVATVGFLGSDVGNFLLPKLTPAGVDQIVQVFLILSASIVLSQATMIERMALMTLGRYGVLASLSIPQIGVLLLLSVAAVAAGSLAALAGAVSVSFLAVTVATVALIHGRKSLAVWRHVTREVLMIALPAAGSYALAILLTRELSAPFDNIAASVIGLILYGAAIIAFLPQYRLLALRLLRSIGKGRNKPGAVATSRDGLRRRPSSQPEAE